MNAFSHCKGCHDRLGSDIPRFYDVALEALGEHGLSMLKAKAQDTELGRTFRKGDKSGELAKHFKAQFERMEALRVKGYTGRLAFEPWFDWHRSAAFELGVYS